MAYVPPHLRGSGTQGPRDRDVESSREHKSGRSLADLAPPPSGGNFSRGGKGGNSGPPKHSFFCPGSNRGGGKGKGPENIDSKRGGGRQSAPRAFGTNDHGHGLEKDADLPEGRCRRVDEEGMVYALEGGSGVVGSAAGLAAGPSVRNLRHRRRRRQAQKQL